MIGGPRDRVRIDDPGVQVLCITNPREDGKMLVHEYRRNDVDGNLWYSFHETRTL